MDEEYFATIPDQSLLVVASGDSEIKTDFQLLLDTFLSTNGLIGASLSAQDFIKNNAEYIKTCLNDLMKDDQGDRASKSKKFEDPSWFQGTDSKFNTKEEAMYHRAQDRIRGYFYKVKDELIKTDQYRNSLGKKNIDDILSLFRMFLQVSYSSSTFSNLINHNPFRAVITLVVCLTDREAA